MLNFSLKKWGGEALLKMTYSFSKKECFCIKNFRRFAPPPRIAPWGGQNIFFSSPLDLFLYTPFYGLKVKFVAGRLKNVYKM